MTYNPAIPQSTDLISNSQPQILTNFAALNTQFGGGTPATGGDHDGFNTGSANGSGMHNQVTFTANQAAPSLTRNAVPGVSGLFANTDGTNSHLFFQNAAGTIPITGALSSAATGYATLPGGLLLQWGETTFVSGSVSKLVFAKDFATIYSATIGPKQPTYMWISATSTGVNSSVTVNRNNTGGFSAFVMAIGI